MLQTSQHFSAHKYTPHHQYNSSLQKISSHRKLEKMKKIQNQMKMIQINGLSKMKKASFREQEAIIKIREINVNPIKNLIDDYFKQELNNQSKMPLFRNKMTPKRMMKEGRKCNNKVKNQQQDQLLSKSVNIQQNQAKQNPQLRKTNTNILRWSISSLENHLPPIHQQTEGQEEHNMYNQMLHLNLTATSFTSKTSRLSSFINGQAQIQQKRRLSFENEIFYIFIITYNNRPIGRMIEYKEKGLQIMQRQLKIKKYHINHLWKESKYNNHSFMTTTNSPIKDLICKMMPDQLNPHQLRITPKQVYKRLLANNCQQLILMLKQFCIQLKKVEGKVINNKINPSNIFLIKDYKLSLAQWGYSSFRQQLNIQQNKYQTRKYGVLRGDKDWFVTPQYLAPEIIKQLTEKQQIDIWRHKASPDIWSLGITLFQILTLIPIWISAKVTIISKPSIVRTGLLSVPDRDLSKILQKQQKLQKSIRNCLNSQLSSSSQKNDNLNSIICRMIEPDPSLRISLDQIIQCL